ncbi:MAG: hypothetical protein FJ263_02910 [Planctomycetes bacterium]|nr:hypothetical protein [Planctomycetota bacterium]
MEPITSEQELKSLLEEGKITHDEYQQLLIAMCKQKSRSGEDFNPILKATDISSKKVPWQIWVVVVLLGLEGIENLCAIPGNFAALGWFLAKVIFICGLFKAWKWVFVAFQIIAGVHVLYFASAGEGVVSLINAVLMILCFTALRYYFPVKTQVNDLYHRSIPQEEQSN